MCYVLCVRVCVCASVGGVFKMYYLANVLIAIILTFIELNTSKETYTTAFQQSSTLIETSIVSFLYIFYLQKYINAS